MRLDKLHLGSARIVTHKEVVAGSVISMTMEYTVGKYGIDDSGNIRIAWRSVSDWEGPQFNNPKGFGFTTVTTNGQAILQCKKGIHQRPFHNCLDIKVRDGNLHEGEVIKIVFGDRSKGSPGIRAQTFAESAHEFRVYVDPLNTCRFELLEEVPTVKVVSGPINEVQVVLPSKVEEDVPFDIIVRVLDEWGNPCKDFEGEIQLRPLKQVVNYQIPSKITIKKGSGFIRLIGNRVKEQGIYHVKAVYKPHNLNGVSNGMVCGTKDMYNLYWGDAHGQTALTIGTGTLDEYFQFAKGPAAIDFTSWQGNDFEISPEKWAKVVDKTKLYNEPGNFVTLLGYEWSGNFPGGGDHNIYFLGDDENYYPHSNWSTGDLHKTSKNNKYPLTELWESFRNRNDVMAVSHIGGRPANLDFFNSEFIKVIEIHSHHGTFEWFAREAMKRGLKVGFIATSDDHTCRPGLSYPLQNVNQQVNAFDVTSGFTAVYAKDLTREAIWEAIQKRRVYATTFARIILGVCIDNHYMGEEINIIGNPTINIDVVGTAPIKSVEVIKGTKTVYKETYNNDQIKTDTKQVKIMWEGVLTKGRRKSTNWDGTIHINNGKICSAKEIAFDRIEQGLTNITNQWISWHSTTSGDMDGLLIEVDATEDSVLSFNSGPINFEIPVSELSTEPKLFNAGGINLKATIALVKESINQNYNKDTYSLKTSFEDKNIEPGLSAYWVKVVQEDGHMAWSSPIFVNKQ